MDATGKEISVGNAAKIAAELTQLSITLALEPDTVFEVYRGLFAQVANEVITLSEAITGPTAGAFVAPQQVQQLQQAFPGSTVQPAPVAPAPAAPAFGAVQAPAAPVVVAPPANVVPFPAQPQGGFAPAPAAPAGFGAPASVPGVAPAGDGDPKTAERWAMFFADAASGQLQTNWEDNRAQKRGDKSPDFKHRTIKDGQYKIGLWVEDKKNPSYVAGQLRALGIA